MPQLLERVSRALKVAQSVRMRRLVVRLYEDRANGCLIDNMASGRLVGNTRVLDSEKDLKMPAFRLVRCIRSPLCLKSVSLSAGE